MFMDNKRNRKAIEFKYRMAEQVDILNHPIIDEFCWDKRIISDMFPECTPKTFLVNTLNGLKTVLPAIRSNKIVIKPRYGTLGKEVLCLGKRCFPTDVGGKLRILF